MQQHGGQAKHGSVPLPSQSSAPPHTLGSLQKHAPGSALHKYRSMCDYTPTRLILPPGPDPHCHPNASPGIGPRRSPYIMDPSQSLSL